MSVHDFPKGERFRYPEIDFPPEGGSIKGEEEHQKSAIVDDYLFVAVGKEVKESRSTVIWALQNSGGKKICILHVHTPQLILNANQASKQEEALKHLDEYVQLCATTGINAKKLHIESNFIENGIIALISQNKIGRLVMGAAADSKFRRNMVLKSKKALYVQSNAPKFCHIWFVCKGNLICIREGVKPVSLNHGVTNAKIQQKIEIEPILDKNSLRNIRERGYSRESHEAMAPRLSSESSSESESHSTSSEVAKISPSTSSRRKVFDSTSSKHSDLSKRSVSPMESSPPSEEYHGRMSNKSSFESEPLSRSSDIDSSYEVFRRSPLPQRRSNLTMDSLSLGKDEYEEASMDGELYDKFNKLKAEAENLRKEVYFEAMKSQKAEKENIEATRKANTMEILYNEEKRQRQEIEEKLANEMKEHESIKIQHEKMLKDFGGILLGKSALQREIDNMKEEAYSEKTKNQKLEKEIIEATKKANTMESLYHDEKRQKQEIEEKLVKEMKERNTIKNQHDKVLQEYGSVLLQKSSLEKEIEKCNILIQELEEKLASVGSLEKYKKQSNDSEVNLENALRENERLKKQLASVSKPMDASRFFADFSYSEILVASDNLNPSRKIGEGGFGETYKGLLRHIDVAIKLLGADSMQGSQEFIQEVDALSKLRHPNIVTLIGVCSEASALIYEYHPNGNLDDRLDRKDNTPPLSWQTRVRIAAELCSVLMFLHASQPKSIIHGDVKPANILLDAHLSCRLSDFGISRASKLGPGPTESAASLYRTNPKGTFGYMDPEYLSTGELTPKSDIYSFGIILLRLLTGRSALGLVEEMEIALEKDRIGAVLDASAGEWPVAEAKELAVLGLRCCELRKRNRPDLERDVWRVLGPMKVYSRARPKAGGGKRAGLGRPVLHP